MVRECSALRFGGVEVVVNDVKFVVSVSDELNEFVVVCEWSVVLVEVESVKIVKKAVCDVGGGLNDGLNDLSDVFMLVGEQMIAPNGLLEFVKIDVVGNESLAKIEIDGEPINLEARQIMETQVWNGRDDGKDGIKLFANVMILNGSASLM